MRGVVPAPGSSEFVVLPELLRTSRLKLRPFAQSDADAVFDYWSSDPSWERFNRSVPSDFARADAERFVAELRARDREDQPSWALVLRNKVVGVVSLTFEQDHRIAVIGYGVHGELRGVGLSAEAAEEVIAQAFQHYTQLVRIRAHTDVRNAASARVLEKLGFSREGVLRSNQYAKGELIDEAVYGLLRDEWQK